MKRKLLIVFLSIITVATYIYSLVNTKELSQNINDCIIRCINVIIPSLFIYMVLSSLIIESGIYKFIFVPLKPLAKYVFTLPISLFFVFVMGNICGYPIGMKLINDMLEKGEIDRKTALVMSASCYGGGPSFLLGLVGISIYNDETAGGIIFLSCLLSNALIAIVINRIYKPQVRSLETSLQKPDLISSITNSAISIFKICAVILSFSFVTTFLDGVFKNADKTAATIIKSFFEITNITALDNASTSYMPIVAAISSFGGVCILLQLKSVTRLTLKYIVLSRLVSCPLSAFLCFVIIKATNYTPSIYASYVYNIKSTSISLLGTILAAILVIFMIFTKEKADS
ncbi:MAG: hypothetical protein LIO41_07975 [Ruminococcus sp.]|nr:hypothetical protein [Ruminococcus sp.]